MKSASASRRARGTGREIPALLACVVWVVGFEIAPFVHAVEHTGLAPHSHAPAPQHCHAGACHDHESAEGSEAPDPEHGEGTLAHRDLAAHSAPPALPPVDPALLAIVVFDPSSPAQPTSPAILTTRARGPPISSQS